MFEIVVGAVILLLGALIAYLAYLMGGIDRRKP
jgi:hypothetical protein